MSVETMNSIKGRPFFCSWSGGKDSCLALYHAIQNGGKPQSLLTVLTEDGTTSRSHALPRSVIQEQAARLGLQAVFRSATWEQYEEEFIYALRGFKKDGIDVGVFGDIDVEPHREWVRRVCNIAGIEPIHPLWQRNRRELLEEFIKLGFKARIIVVNEQMLDKNFLGKSIDAGTISEMEKAGIDPSGELGEYHTVVTECPIFSSKMEIKTSDIHSHDGYRFLNVSL
jgi:diphthine-ammonia ligase